MFFFRRKVRRDLTTIRREGLHGINTPPRTGYSRGVEVLGEKLDKAVYLSAQSYRRRHKKPPDLIEPVQFTEKLLLYKFFGLIPTSPAPSDKLSCMHYVPDSHRHLVKAPARTWVRASAELPHNSEVPAGRYYLKSNHGCGTNLPVNFPLTQKERKKLQKLTNHWMTHIHSPKRSLWWYDTIDRRIYLEEDIADQSDTANDWKFFVFHGRVEIFQVDSDRRGDHTQTVYQRDGAYLDEELYYKNGAAVPMPPQLHTMIDVAEAIGQQFEFIRVDLFLQNSTIYLGEITLVPTGAVRQIRSSNLDTRLGEAWQPGWLGRSMSQPQVEN